ncbi:Metallo-hydrolase/oxidoreductase, partial [Trichodelitschia bisporula]
MSSSVSVITAPTADTPGALLCLRFDNARYLVGRVGEGSQRACVEQSVGLKKVRDLILTGRAGTEGAGGVLGMMLTLADVVRTSREDMIANAKGADTEENPTFLRLYGAPGMMQMVATARAFIFRKGLPVHVYEMEGEEVVRNEKGEWLPTWADDNVRVWAMPIEPETEQTSGPSRKRSFDEVDPEVAAPRKRTISPPDTPAASATPDFAASEPSVVADMFSSTWRLDSLQEVPLRTVQRPAVIWVRDPTTRDLVKYTGPYPGEAPLPEPDMKVYIRRPWPAALINALPPTTPSPKALSYIIGTYPRRGKFDRDAAVRLGVQRGPDFGHLTNGQSVLNKDGKTITPDMVVGPDRQGGGIAVIDLPTPDYVAPTLRRAEWNAPEVMRGVGAVVWILGPGVAAVPALASFMADLEKRGLHNIVASPDTCPNRLSMVRAAQQATRLALLDPVTYPVPHFDNTVVPQAGAGLAQDRVSVLPETAIPAVPGTEIMLEPRFELRHFTEQPDPLALDNTPDTLEAIRLAREAREAISPTEHKAWRASLPPLAADTTVVTLGTGSALPSRYRNVSATLIRVPGWGSYLLDCGENTLGQLRRVFPPAELEEVLRDLRGIWVSHLHADHHLGTVAVIRAWRALVHGSGTTPRVSSAVLDSKGGEEARSPYLAVMADVRFMHYLSEFAGVEDFGFEYVLPLAVRPGRVDQSGEVRFMLPAQGVSIPVPADALRRLVGLANVQACPVIHCHGAMAVVLSWPTAEGTEPLKVAYSGDCRPSRPFAALGKGATLLVHEATFEEGLEGEARAKKHSTVGEALEVGRRIGARAVVLTHFSQRYQKVPVVEGAKGVCEIGSGREVVPPGIADGVGGENGDGEGHEWRERVKVAVAFDYMRFRLGDM